jgi:hypothetical protein
MTIIATKVLNHDTYMDDNNLVVLQQNNPPPDIEMRFALATAIATQGCRAMLIGPDNENAGWMSIEEAVAQDRCYGVLAGPDMLVLDGDTSEQTKTVWEIFRDLRDQEYKPVILRSGQADRLHLFARIKDQAVLASYRKRASKAEIDTRSTGGDRIRPPLTRHRLGLPVALLEPHTPEAALACLKSSTPWSATSRRTDPRLTKKTFKLLRWGDPQRQGDESGSSITYSIALGAAAVGYSGDKLYSLMLKPENLGGEKTRRDVHEKGEAKAKYWFLKYVWAKAEEQVKKNPTITDPDEAVLKLCEMALEVEDYKWDTTALKGSTSKVSGNTLRKLCVVVIQMGITHRTFNPLLPQLTLTELAAMDVQSVRKGLKGLEQLGWIRKNSTGYGTKASEYKLLVGSSRKNPPHSSPPRGVFKYRGFDDVSHDLFQSGGALGDSGRRVLHCLDSIEGLEAKEVSDILGLKVATTRNKLNRLAVLGFALKIGRVWYRVEGDLDEAAVVVGTAGRAERRKKTNDFLRSQHVESYGEYLFLRAKEESSPSEGEGHRSYARSTLALHPAGDQGIPDDTDREDDDNLSPGMEEAMNWWLSEAA